MNDTRISAPAGMPIVDIEREFDAPRDLVRRAWSEPDLVKRWLGPRRYDMEIERWEPRAGGSYRYVHRDPDSGMAFGFRGVFHAYDIDHRVQTFEFDGAPGHVSMDTLTLEDLGNGRTRARTRSVFQSVEDRDAMIEHGMAGGVTEGFERLDEVLAALREPAGAIH